MNNLNAFTTTGGKVIFSVGGAISTQAISWSNTQFTGTGVNTNPAVLSVSGAGNIVASTIAVRIFEFRN